LFLSCTENMVNGSNPSSTIGKHNKEFFLKNYESTVQIYNKSQDVLVEYLNGSRTLTPQNREAIQKGYTILLQLADLKKDDITFSINPDIKYSYEYALGITKKNDNFSGFWNFYYKAVVYWFLFILIPFGILNGLSELRQYELRNKIRKMIEPYYKHN
ncbi:hypothetical protein X964_19635, partial [Acinetobacter baumannii MDR_MMC4]